MVRVSSYEGALHDCMRAVVAHEPVISVPLHDAAGQLEHRLTAYGSAQSVAPEIAARDTDHPRPSQEQSHVSIMLNDRSHQLARRAAEELEARERVASDQAIVQP